jgi:plasmid stabilization system protein ParE
MGYQVVFSPIAEADLHEIIAYIPDDNPEAATKLGAELIRLAFTLVEMPRRGGNFVAGRSFADLFMVHT